MEGLSRFSDYEFFAYFIVGACVILVSDFAFGTHWIIATQWTVPEGLAIALAAYVIGQSVASPAAWLLERKLVRRVLKPPSDVLFGVGKIPRLRTFLFAEYYTPLNDRVRSRVESRGRSAVPVVAPGESLFWEAYTHAKRDTDSAGRLEAFLKMYGFCRNLTFVAGMAALIFFVEAVHDLTLAAPTRQIEIDGLRAGIALAVCICMFYRFLKFYRLYGVEVFVSYAGLPVSEKG